MNSMKKKSLFFTAFGLTLLLLPVLGYGASATTTTTSNDVSNDSCEQVSGDLVVTPQYRVMQLLHTLAALNDELATAQFNPNELFQVHEKVEQEKKNIAHQLNNLRKQINLPLIALNFLGFWFLKEANKTHDLYYITLTHEVIAALFKFAELNENKSYCQTARAVGLTLYYVAPGFEITDRETALANAEKAIWTCVTPKTKKKCLGIIKDFHQNHPIKQHPDKKAFNKCMQNLSSLKKNKKPKETFKTASYHVINFLETHPNISLEEIKKIKHEIAKSIKTHSCLLQLAPCLLSVIDSYKPQS